MRQLLSIICVALFAQCAGASSEADKALFEKHKPDALLWLSKQSTVHWTRSHYGPWFHATLSVRRVEGKSYIDYYLPFRPKVKDYGDWDAMKAFPFHPGDILVRYDIDAGVFMLVSREEYHKTKTEPNKAPEPTPTAVTPPAGQESRQP